jgi:hypothetical protein
VKGRRRGDVREGDLPHNFKPGDFWKVLDRETGEPCKVTHPGKLTEDVWKFCAPTGGVGTLEAHTVREHDDGTISVRPGDGSSNSIGFDTGGKRAWHGYIEKGEWQEC